MCKGCHVVCVKAEIKSLHALCRAVHRLGGEFKFGQNTFRWFGSWVGDYDEADAAHRHDIKPEDYGKCDHALHFPGADYEVGILKQGEREQLSLAHAEGIGLLRLAVRLPLVKRGSGPTATGAVGGRGGDRD